MRHLLPLLLGCLLALAAAPARAADAVLRYTLSMDGKAVGSRELTLTSLPAEPGGPSVRMTSSFTELQVTLAGVPWSFQQRASAVVRDGRSSFTSSVQENGRLREVQARQGQDGRWRVVVLEADRAGSGELRASEVTLTSMDLFDPDARLRLTTAGTARVLAAETGTVLEGPVEDLGEGVVRIAGQDVAVHRWAWTPAAGRMELSWSMDGLLVAYQTTVAGKKLDATLTQAPAGLSFGEVEDPRADRPTVREEEL
jgi:hypothetical protein